MLENQRSVIISRYLVTFVGGAYLVLLFVAGFLTNFLPVGTINTGTVLLYSFACLLSFLGLLYLFNPVPRHVAIGAGLVITLSVLAVIKSFLDVNPLSERTRELAIFFSGSWPLLFFIQMNDPKVQRRFREILSFGLFGLSIFGIFQGVFANSLPLNLFVLRGDEAFGLYDVNTLRPTGLTGNPIIFSSILVYASAYFYALWLGRRRRRYFYALFASLLANYLTYTRASLVLVIPVLIFVWLFHKRFQVKHKMAVLTCLVLGVVGAQLLLTRASNLMIVERLRDSNPEAAASTFEHFEQIQNARYAIASHPWLGTGMGSDSDFVGQGDAIITDGAWWMLFLEFGAPLSILILVSLGIVLTLLTRFIMWRGAKNRELVIAMVAFHAYLIPGSFIDSGILGHVSFGLYWAALGLSLAAIDRNNYPRSENHHLSQLRLRSIA